MAEPSRARRLLAIPALLGAHFVAYETTATLVPLRARGDFVDLSTPLDVLVPYLPWTWVVYWSVWPFVVAGGVAILAPVTEAVFRRTVAAFLLLTALGPVFHIALPSHAPWLPAEQLVPIQRAVHAAAAIRPHANLPSMHVAYPALVTLIWLARRPSWRARVGAPLLTLAIAASTVTLKEHYVVDPLGGLLLAAAVWSWWRSA